MITFIFCVCSCLIGVMVGGLAVDFRRRRELERLYQSRKKLVQIISDQDNNLKRLLGKVE
jgi:hypothetical protein